MATVASIKQLYSQRILNLKRWYMYHHKRTQQRYINYYVKARILKILKSQYNKYHLWYVNQMNKDLRIEREREEKELALKDEKEKVKALLIGINYKNTDNELIGCINDTNNMKEFLISNKRVNSENICCLTDDTTIKPTRENIIDKYKNLLTNAKRGDTIYFTYSGHGKQTLDANNDELDGIDEALFTIDEKYIIDDELKVILKNVNEGVNVFILFDCCHSGTLMDLKYSYLSSTDIVSKNSSETKANVYFISGCRDNQLSREMQYKGRPSQGAMNWAFLKIMNQNNDISWKELILRMRNLLKPYFIQIPQLCSGRELDIDSKVII